MCQELQMFVKNVLRPDQMPKSLLGNQAASPLLRNFSSLAKVLFT